MNSGQEQIARGALGALFLVLAASLALLPLAHLADLEPSAGLLRALAQIGATLLVAYAIELSWLLKVSGDRGESRANWVGYVSGIGLSGLFGIALALIYAENDTADLAVVPEFGLSWVLVSLSLLGLLVALLPLLVFEWSQAAVADDRDGLGDEGPVGGEDAPTEVLDEPPPGGDGLT